MAELEEGRDRKPERKAQGRPLLAPRPRARPDPGDPRRDHLDRRRDQGLRGEGSIRGPSPGPKGRFRHLLVIGIGGSALGPQFVCHALGRPGRDRMKVHFFDNTDPDGMDYVLAGLGDEPGPDAGRHDLEVGRHGRNPQRPARGRGGVHGGGPLLPEAFCRRHRTRARSSTSSRRPRAGSPASPCGTGSAAARANSAPWDSCRRPSRASTSTPCWREPRPWTRSPAARSPARTRPRSSPSCGISRRTGAVRRTWSSSPTRTGSSSSRATCSSSSWSPSARSSTSQGNVVNQGIAVYGNKGSTDQHAYVQQLREGVKNFFVTFIDVLKDRSGGRARGRARHHGRRLPPRLLPGHPRCAEREGPRVDHAHPFRRLGALARDADRPLRAGRRALRLARLDQRLRPARRRGRKEGGDRGHRPPAAPRRRPQGRSRKRLHRRGLGRAGRRRPGDGVQDPRAPGGQRRRPPRLSETPGSNRPTRI